MRRAIVLIGLVVVMAAGLCAHLAVAEPEGPATAPLAVRVEQFSVPPATGPTGGVILHNRGRVAWTGTVKVDLGDGWRIEQPAGQVRVEPGETTRVAYTVQQAKVVVANRYSVRVVASGPGGEVVHKQAISCTSAPYGKVAVDGETGDWDGAIPVRFGADGKAVVVRTLWSRRIFAMLVAVEEDQLVKMTPGGKTPCDAVGVAISRWPAETPAAGEKALRHEFLLASTDDGPRSFRLMQPGDKLTREPRVDDLADRRVEGAKLAVRRREGRTFYEWSIPTRALAPVRPAVGRTICLSVLVHDPDGAGLRDYGAAAGLWPCQRNARAWTRWPGSKWPKEAPFDSKIEWGLCSSAQ